MELKFTRHPLERPNYCCSMRGAENGGPVEISDLELDSRLENFLSGEWGIKELFPPQAASLPLALKGESLVLSIPTASGKSLVAYTTMLQRLTTDLIGCKGFYIVPLKALASEKFEELKAISSQMGLKVGLAIGDRSGEMSSMKEADILVCTSEKLDSIIRGGSSILDDIGIVVADEFHMLQDPNRGPTLEILLSRIMHHRGDVQILALSATVGNGEKLANWLGARLIRSEWRPVTLYCGTITGLEINFHSVDGPGEDKLLPESRTLEGGTQKSIHAVLDDTVGSGGQLLVFVSSRSSAQKEARELSNHVISKVKNEDENYGQDLVSSWKEISEACIDRGEESITVKLLRNALMGGVAFHHAGLGSKHRKIIEDGFKEGKITCLVATPTLAQGVNLPASRVLIRDSRRWNTIAARNIPLPVMEIRQMLGRAGRPGFDDFGESLLISKNKEGEEDLVERYLRGQAEDVSSKLANPSAMNVEEDGALLTHVLSIISSAGINDRDGISMFLSKTFLATQMHPEILEGRVDDVICWLVENGMIERMGESEEVTMRIRDRGGTEIDSEEWQDDLPSWADSASNIPGLDLFSRNYRRDSRISRRRGPAVFGFTKANIYESDGDLLPEPVTMSYKSTKLGSLVSRLYLNPISGKIIYDGLTNAMRIISGDDEIGQLSPMSILHLAACTPDFIPLWLRKDDFDVIQEALHGHERELLAESIDLEEERRMKGVLVVQSWIEEESLGAIENQWGVQPGDLRGRVELLEWLIFAMRRIVSDDPELAKFGVSAQKTLFQSIDEVHRRVRFGCKSDILGLVAIRGVGRIRAREMSSLLGVTSASDVAMMTERDCNILSEQRGWSPNLVEKMKSSAKYDSVKKH